MYENKITGHPSVCVGGIAVDFGKDETPAQAELIKSITNHPDAILQNDLRVPLTPEIITNFLEVINETIRSNSQKIEITHQVRHAVDAS